MKVLKFNNISYSYKDLEKMGFVRVYSVFTPLNEYYSFRDERLEIIVNAYDIVELFFYEEPLNEVKDFYSALYFFLENDKMRKLVDEKVFILGEKR